VFLRIEKRLVDELFMHYFHNLSSASSSITEPRWGQWGAMVGVEVVRSHRAATCRGGTLTR